MLAFYLVILNRYVCICDFIISAFSQNSELQKEQLKDLLPKLDINKICHSLAKKGYLFRLKRETYLIQREPSKKPIIEDPFLIPDHLYKGYLAFSTALKIHGLLEYEPFTIFFATNYKSRTFSIGQYTFKIVNMGDKAEGITRIDDYIASNLEKTFFDCFYKPDFAGGYQNIVKAMYDARLNWKLFLTYFERFASNSLCQRTSHILKLMPEKIGYRIPSFVIKSLKRKGNIKLPPAGGLFGWYDG